MTCTPIRLENKPQNDLPDSMELNCISEKNPMLFTGIQQNTAENNIRFIKMTSNTKLSRHAKKQKM